MTKVVRLNTRGTLTLPKELRLRLGVKNGGQIVAEETDNGVLLRPSATIPIEIYPDSRLAEFKRNNEDALSGYRFKKKK